MYQGIHERRATPPGTNIARSLRVTGGPWRDFVARLAHRLSYGASARALSRQGARVTRSTLGSIRGSLLVLGPERRAPAILRIERDFDLPGAAADWAVLHVGLLAASALVDDEFDRLCAVRTAQRQWIVHPSLAADTSSFAGAPANCTP